MWPWPAYGLGGGVTPFSADGAAPERGFFVVDVDDGALAAGGGSAGAVDAMGGGVTTVDTGTTGGAVSTGGADAVDAALVAGFGAGASSDDTAMIAAAVPNTTQTPSSSMQILSPRLVPFGTEISPRESEIGRARSCGV